MTTLPDQELNVTSLGSQEVITSMEIKKLSFQLIIIKCIVKIFINLVKTGNNLLSFDDFIDKFGSENNSIEKGK